MRSCDAMRYQINGERPDFSLKADYVVGDTHFNHSNIVSPKSRVDCRSADLEQITGSENISTQSMNELLIERWNDTVSENDSVVFLGDFNLDSSPNPQPLEEIYDDLNGNITYVIGDHDIHDGALDLPSQIEPANHEDLNYWGIIEGEEYDMLGTHFPDENTYGVPGGSIDSRIKPNLPQNLFDEWNGSVVHGHHHNNWLGENKHNADYPLYNPDEQTLNVSVELVDYSPVSVSKLEHILRRDSRVESLREA